MRTFDFTLDGRVGGELMLTKDELSCALPILVLQVFSFTVTNIDEGKEFLVSYRNHPNDNDVCMLKDIQRSVAHSGVLIPE